MLVSFGSFWGGEGRGIEWWAGDVFLIVLVIFYLCLGAVVCLWLRSRVSRLGQPGRAAPGA